MIAIVFPLLTAALYYLGSWALVTRWLWSRYPSGLARFMDCAACSGFWYGVLVSVASHADFLGLPWRRAGTHVVVGLCSMVWTPIVAGLHLWCMSWFDQAAADQEPREMHYPPRNADNPGGTDGRP